MQISQRFEDPSSHSMAHQYLRSILDLWTSREEEEDPLFEFDISDIELLD